MAHFSKEYMAVVVQDAQDVLAAAGMDSAAQIAASAGRGCEVQGTVPFVHTSADGSVCAAAKAAPIAAQTERPEVPCDTAKAAGPPGCKPSTHEVIMAHFAHGKVKVKAGQEVQSMSPSSTNHTLLGMSSSGQSSLNQRQDPPAAPQPVQRRSRLACMQAESLSGQSPLVSPDAHQKASAHCRGGPHQRMSQGSKLRACQGSVQPSSARQGSAQQGRAQPGSAQQGSAQPGSAQQGSAARDAWGADTTAVATLSTSAGQDPLEPTALMKPAQQEQTASLQDCGVIAMTSAQTADEDSSTGTFIAKMHFATQSYRLH